MQGDFSKRIEALPDEQVQEEVMSVLRSMYPNITIPDPLDFIFPRWHSDLLYRGSYSNWPSSFISHHHDNLRANIDRLFFAGEATSQKYFGQFFFLLSMLNRYRRHPSLSLRFLARSVLRRCRCCDGSRQMHQRRSVYRAEARRRCCQRISVRHLRSCVVSGTGNLCTVSISYSYHTLCTTTLHSGVKYPMFLWFSKGQASGHASIDYSAPGIHHIKPTGCTNFELKRVKA
jgi:Flavin containing amine oxidoreductase